MGLFESARRPAKTTQQYLPWRFLFPSPAPPRKKHPCPTQHVSPSNFPSPVFCPRDRSHSQSPSVNPGNDHVLTSSRTHISILLSSHGNNDRVASHPESDFTSSQDLAPHPKWQIQQNDQEQHSPNKLNRDVCPHNGLGLPLTYPSPGANPTIYPSSLPPE